METFAVQTEQTKKEPENCKHTQDKKGRLKCKSQEGTGWESGLSSIMNRITMALRS